MVDEDYVLLVNAELLAIWWLFVELLHKKLIVSQSITEWQH
jgi:hypothetical protein